MLAKHHLVSLRIPAQVWCQYGARSWVRLAADTAAATLVALDGRNPGMGQRLTEADGQLRQWVNVFGEGQDVRALNG